jgi:hypothetical protein
VKRRHAWGTQSGAVNLAILRGGGLRALPCGVTARCSACGVEARRMVGKTGGFVYMVPVRGGKRVWGLVPPCTHRGAP